MYNLGGEYVELAVCSLKIKTLLHITCVQITSNAPHIYLFCLGVECIKSARAGGGAVM